MTLFLPTIQLLLTLAVLGTDPKNLKIGIVNEEIPNFVENCLAHKATSRNLSSIETGLETTSCDFAYLSCNLITELSQTGVIDTVSVRSTLLHAHAYYLEKVITDFHRFRQKPKE